MFSVLADSELTYTGSRSKKRSRCEPDSSMVLSHPRNHVQSTLYGSTGASPSGLTAIPAPVAQPLVATLYNQSSVEIDVLIRLQTERLQWGLEEQRKKQCTSLLSMVYPHMVKRLKEKELELQRLNQRNIELEERVRHIASESQVWFDHAKNTDAIVSSLRINYEQALTQTNEGYGESQGADDAESCCFGRADEETAVKEKALRRENEALRERRACRVCRETASCVLLLPCRHLCLCKVCDSTIDTCPVCHSSRNASLQIIF